MQTELVGRRKKKDHQWVSLSMMDKGDEMRRRRRNLDAPQEIIGGTSKEFFENTTIHGLRYFVKDDWGWLERVLWACIVMGSFIVAIIFIYNSLSDDPTITTIRASTLPVQLTQFPTVTVCPGEHSDEDHLGFLRRYLNHWKYECFDGNCEDTEEARELLRFWIDEMFENKFKEFLSGEYENKRHGCYRASTKSCSQSLLDALNDIGYFWFKDHFRETALNMMALIKEHVGKRYHNNFITEVLTPYVVSEALKDDSGPFNTTGWDNSWTTFPDPEKWTALILSFYSPWETICTLRDNMEQCSCSMTRGIGTFLTFGDRSPAYAKPDLATYSNRGQRGENALPEKIESGCITSNTSEPPNQPCIFPFFVEGKPVYTCQKFQNDGSSWCATEVDGSGNVVTRGECDPDKCESCKTVAGNTPAAPCRLPFTFDGRLYWICTRKGWHKPWCSTAVSEPNFAHQGGLWGICNDLCPTPTDPWPFVNEDSDKLDVSISQGLQRFNDHLKDVYGKVVDDEENNTLSFLDVSLLLANGEHVTKWNWYYIIDEQVLGEDNFGYHIKSVAMANDPVCNTTEMLHLGKKWYKHFLSRTVDDEDAELEPNPCNETLTGMPRSPCCGYWGKKLARGLSTVMSMMRNIKPQGKITESSSRFAERFKLKEYETVKLKEDFDSGPFERYQRQMIPSCHFAQGIKVKQEQPMTDEGGFTVEKRCGAFEPILTTRGLCSSFNGQSVEELYQQSEHRDAFMDAFDTPMKSNVVNVSSHGPDFVFKFVLDASTVGDKARVRLPNKFLLSLNNEFSPFNVANNAIRIAVGYTTKLAILPFQQVAAETLRELSLEERKCRFRDESETMKIFKHYTLSGCQAECMMELSEQECGCRPWDFPHAPGPVEEICDYYGQICFHQQMANVTQLKSCDCMENCEIVTYTYTQTREKIDANHFNCFRESYPQLSSVVMFRGTGQRLNDYFEGVPPREYNSETYCNFCECGESKECQDFINRNIALVEIEIATPTLIQTELAKRISASNQIGILGGNLGLFTGISVISIFEMIFWLKRLMFNSNKPRAQVKPKRSI